MNYILALLVVLILSIGNFFPLLEADFSLFLIKFLLFCGVVSVFFLNIKKTDISKTLFYYLVVVSFIFFTSAFRSLDLVYAVDKYLSVTLVVLFAYYFFTEIFRRVGLNKSIELIVLNGAFILMLTIIYKLFFGFWIREVRFFLNGSIVFGWMMALYSLLSLYLFQLLNKKRYFFLTFVFFIAVLWAESKGPILGYILALIFYLTYNSKFFIKASLCVLGVLSFIFSNKIIHFLDKILSETRFSALLRVIKGEVSSQDAGSITIRQDMLLESYHLFYNNIFHGIGLGNYQFHTIYGFIYPHNIHLEIFMECGFFVGIIYILFLGVSFYNSIPLVKALLLLFFVCGCFSGDITYLRFLIFICLIGLFLNRMDVHSVRVIS